MTDTDTTPAVSVPAEHSTVSTCPYCERPFPKASLRDLHLGEVHETALTEAERESYEDAHEAESNDLFVLHIAVVIGLVIAFFAIAYLYAFVLAG